MVEALWPLVARCTEGLQVGAEFLNKSLGKPDTTQEVRVVPYNSLVAIALSTADSVLVLFWLSDVAVLTVDPQDYWNVISDVCTLS